MEAEVNEWIGRSRLRWITLCTMSAETRLLRVPSIGCEGCARAISQALSQLPEVKAVQVNWAEKTVLVTAHERANWERVRQTLIEIGYAPQP